MYNRICKYIIFFLVYLLFKLIGFVTISLVFLKIWQYFLKSIIQPVKTQQAQSTTTVVEAQQRSDIVGKKPLHI